LAVLSKVDLRIDWATHEAAKYACENWHYSKCLPVGKLVKIGAWEDGQFIGVVLFGRGANKSLGEPYGCGQTNSCELVRIALKQHKNAVSKIMAVAFKFFKKMNPEMKLVISFADTEAGHHGGIYQATNWIYDGLTNSADEYLYQGKKWHGRAFRKSHGSHLNFIDKGLQIIKGARKHRYLMPLDEEMRKRIMPLAKPYPKRVKQANSGDQLERGGAAPTYTLQSSAEVSNVSQTA
jgi:hypothetical protein